MNVHDLNHDGRLFRDSASCSFAMASDDQRARPRVRQSRVPIGGDVPAPGLARSTLDIAYDMSVPNVAHLEPQQGGCCTVMPYFIGDVLELPLTTAQDYTLFHVLGDYSTRLWKEQIALILASNGLVSFIVHPDYLFGTRERDVYVDLLTHLAQLRDERARVGRAPLGDRPLVAEPPRDDGWCRTDARGGSRGLAPSAGAWRTRDSTAGASSTRSLRSRRAA